MLMTTTNLIVRYVETDQMGIVHHSVYPIWYEVARTDFGKKAGIPYSQMEEEGLLTPLVELHCKYIRPAHYEEELEIKTRISKLTPVKVEFSYEVFKKGETTPINTGTTLHALVGKDLKPINAKKLHPEIYQVMENCMQEDV